MGTDATFFDKIGIQYEEAFGHDPGLIEFINQAMGVLPERASVLDIGCGTGKPVCGTIAASGREIYGIDQSATMVELSRKQVPNGSFEQVNMWDFQPKARFDAAFATFSLFNMGNNIGPMLKKINDWIAPNGYLFIGTMSADDYGNEPHTVSHDELSARRASNKFMGATVSNMVYTKQGWRELLHRAGFEILKTSTSPFQPPKNFDCGEEELHHYITARKLAVNGVL